jgi:uncharacterized protein YecT (DUF1311 family)
MATRDLIAEMLEVKGRRGEGLTLYRLGELQQLWTSRRAQWGVVADFFPMRAVTLLEVFTRNWLAFLIDQGSPYLENAAPLFKGGIKIDFAVLQAVHGSHVTIGELAAHSVSVNSVGDIDDCLSAVVGEKFFTSIADTYDRFAVEREGQPQLPIIPDVRAMKADLAELFRIRHILTHESPRDAVFAEADVDRLLSSAHSFARASDQKFLTMLYGDYPLTTLDMQESAKEAWGLANQELADLYAQVEAKVTDVDLLRRSRAAWESYRDLQSELRSEHLAGGSYQNIAYARELKRLTQQQTESLRWWLKPRDDGIEI